MLGEKKNKLLKAGSREKICRQEIEFMARVSAVMIGCTFADIFRTVIQKKVWALYIANLDVKMA